jgi:cytochrome c oxidase subunit I+III
VPVYVTGPMNHSWWAMIVLMVVSGMTFGCLLFSYLFLWLVNPGHWPPPGAEMPGLMWSLGAGALYLAASGLVAQASGLLRGEDRRSPRAVAILLGLAVPLMIGAVGLDLSAQVRAALSPEAHAYGAAVYTIIALQAFFVITTAIMGLYTIARWWAGKLDSVRRSTFDNTMLFWHYTTAQGLVGLIVVHGFPRLTGGA